MAISNLTWGKQAKKWTSNPKNLNKSYITLHKFSGFAIWYVLFKDILIALVDQDYVRKLWIYTRNIFIYLRILVILLDINYTTLTFSNL